ncbi:uncharacterized protein LOC135194598 [Vanessa tameamea]|uniref:Uncharacterized protein LOC135194598 n=1 Tax=Vanessa tameamea TaxID=334116 RepID=A0ABM4AYB8_VANTA
MTTKPKLISKFEILSSVYFASDYRMLRATLNLNVTKRNRRNFSNPSLTLKTLKEQDTYLENLKSYIPELISTSTSYKADDYCQKIEHTILNSIKNIKTNTRNKILSDEALELMKLRNELQSKIKLNKNDKEKFKMLYKTTNKEIKSCYNTYRINTIKKHIDKSRSAKKAYKELNKTKNWITCLHSSSNKAATWLDIIKVATDFYANLYGHSNSTHHRKTTNQTKNKSPTPEFTGPEILIQITKLKSEKSLGQD